MEHTAPPPTVVVIGAGVIGLSCALKLQDILSRTKSTQNVEVLLAAREWPTSIPGAPTRHAPDYASMWAGAHVRPIPASTPQLKREAGWLKRTAAEFSVIADAEPWAGVFRTKGIEFLEAPDAAYRGQTRETFEAETGLDGYRVLDASEMPPGVELGFEYSTFCVNPPVYCASMLRKFLIRGGKTLERDFRSEWEAFSVRPDVILAVNASGIGFGDRKYFPTRGHTVITDATEAKNTVTKQNKDGTWTFIVPRAFNGGTIIGGTKEPGNWQIQPDATTRQRLVERGTDLLPYAGQGDAAKPIQPQVIADVVGRRPTRDGGMRIQVVEEQATGTDGQLRTGHVIHAYGAGGRGYEISWGVAQDVSDMARALLPSLMRSRARL